MGKIIVVIVCMAVAGVLSAFYAVNEYANGTGAIVKSADRNADRFEAVIRDLVAARFRAMNIAADVMLQSRVTIEAFARDDRAALVGRMEPFFKETLEKNHGVAQLNFWQPPAKLYYRAGDPKSFGQDLGTFRKSVVAANERRPRISAIETGAGGVIAIRAIVPVNVDDKHVGVVERHPGTGGRVNSRWLRAPATKPTRTARLLWKRAVRVSGWRHRTPPECRRQNAGQFVKQARFLRGSSRAATLRTSMAEIRAGCRSVTGTARRQGPSAWTAIHAFVG